MNINRDWVLVIAANIIHLRLNTDERARISSSLVLLICITLPKNPLIRILMVIAGFIMVDRIKMGASFCHVIKIMFMLTESLGTTSKNHL